MSSRKTTGKLMGVTAVTAGKYLRGDGKPPPADMLARVVKATGCSARWLLTGEGEPNEDANRQLVIAPAGEDVSGADDNLVAIRVLADPAAAGPGHVINERDVEGVGVIHRAWCPHPEETDYVRVKGDSMEPRIPDGALVTIDKSESAPRRLVGHIVAIWQAGTDDVTIARTLLASFEPVRKRTP